MLSYPTQYSQWSLNAHVYRRVQTNGSKHTLYSSFCVRNKLKDSVVEGSVHDVCAPNTWPHMCQSLLSSLACKCFSPTSCFSLRAPHFQSRCIFNHPFWVATSTFLILLPLLLFTCLVKCLSLCHTECVCVCVFFLPSLSQTTLLFTFCAVISVLYPWVTVCHLGPAKHLPASFTIFLLFLFPCHSFHPITSFLSFFLPYHFLYSLSLITKPCATPSITPLNL